MGRALLHSRAVHATRRHLSSFAWIALVAIWALALLPTLSRAMAALQGEGTAWAEICTAQGMKRVVLDHQADGPAQPAMAGGHLDHCPLCGLAAQAVALPPAPPQALDLSTPAAHLPPLFLHAPHTLSAWCPAQPRAPPLNP